VAVGFTFATVTPASSATMCPWPSFTVSVTVNAPSSSLQVKLGLHYRVVAEGCRVVPASTTPFAT